MGVSENSGTPKSSVLIGFSIINHPFWGFPLFWETPTCFEEKRKLHVAVSSGGSFPRFGAFHYFGPRRRTKR